MPRHYSQPPGCRECGEPVHNQIIPQVKRAVPVATATVPLGVIGQENQPFPTEFMGAFVPPEILPERPPVRTIGESGPGREFEPTVILEPVRPPMRPREGFRPPSIHPVPLPPPPIALSDPLLAPLGPTPGRKPCC